jgi:DNA mismatch repair protein MutS2
MYGEIPWRKEGIVIHWDETTWAELDVAYCWNLWQPLTPMGKRAKRRARPFRPGEEREWEQVLCEQDEIKLWLAAHPRCQTLVSRCLEKMPDIEGPLDKLGADEVLGLTDWFHMKQFLWQLGQLHHLMREHRCTVVSLMPEEDVPLVEQCLARLNPGTNRTAAFWIDDAYDDDLRHLRQQWRRMEIKERERVEQCKREIEEAYGIRRNRLGTWTIPRHTPLEEALRRDRRVVCEAETAYDVTFRLPEVAGHEMARLQEQVEAREQAVCVQLTEEFRRVYPRLRYWMQQVTHFDLQWSRYHAGQKWAGVRPVWDGDRFILEGAIHPGIAQDVAAEGRSVTPIDLEVGRGVTVITGPNMGGKTVALKTVGLIAVLAHYGLFVPATACRLPLMHWIASTLGDGQSTKQGLSRFGAEVVRLTEWLNQPGEGLLLLDEIGRGTNPREGAALAQAITSRLSDGNDWAVHVTHYHEVNQLSGICRYRVAGLSWTDLEREGLGSEGAWRERLHRHMDYRLIPVQREEALGADALRLALLLGLPEEIVADAERRLGSGEDEGKTAAKSG